MVSLITSFHLIGGFLELRVPLTFTSKMILSKKLSFVPMCPKQEFFPVNTPKENSGDASFLQIHSSVFRSNKGYVRFFCGYPFQKLQFYFYSLLSNTLISICSYKKNYRTYNPQVRVDGFLKLISGFRGPRVHNEKW